MRNRHQRGQIFESHGAFFVRYYVTTGGDRRRVSQRLCTKERRTWHGSKSATAVVTLGEDFMRTINGHDGAPDFTMAAFWERTFLPFNSDGNLKPSTVQSYEHIWNTRLGPHFANLTLRD